MSGRDFAADDFAAIAARLRELEAERQARLSDDDSAAEPEAVTLEDLTMAVMGCGG